LGSRSQHTGSFTSGNLHFHRAWKQDTLQLCWIRFEKARRFFGGEARPFEVRMEIREGDQLSQRANALFAEGKSVRQVAKELAISKSRAGRLRELWGGDEHDETEALPFDGNKEIGVSHCPKSLGVGQRDRRLPQCEIVPSSRKYDRNSAGNSFFSKRRTMHLVNDIHVLTFCT
jgi:hypothetical protein